MSTKRSFDEYKTGKLTHQPKAMEEAPRNTTPPPIQAPTAKEKKYDRQLRLWAAAGQRALEEAHVLLIVGDEVGSNSSVAGAETLKNLILPSIGNFTVADAATVQNADLGVNFFLETASLGRSRAEETVRLLQELNPDVTGHAISEPLAQWLSQEDSSALKPYNLILVSAPIPAPQLQIVSSYALQHSIPLVYIQSVGFHSIFSVQLPEEFPIVDTHPDPESTQDLRLLAPWPELVALADTLGNVEAMDDHDHGHIPYLLILLHELKKWKASHEDKYPATFKEKTAFREQVRAAARTDNPEGGEENYDEACAAVLKSIGPPSLGAGCEEMFKHPSCQNPSSTSANFWLIAHAIHKFYTIHNVIPLPGSVPDMKARSSDYIKLQNIYLSKARADVAEVTTIVRHLEAALSRQSSPIPAAEIEQFCKNAAHVRVLTNPSRTPLAALRLAQADPKTLAALPGLLKNYDTISPILVALHKPFLDSDTLASLLADNNAEADEEEGGEGGNALQKAIEDVDRCAGAELHNTASLTGGMVAQEIIKLITRQYVPVDGTCIWDGVRCKTEIVKF